MYFLFRNSKIKVGFVVAGAQKAGTTSLDHYLRLHPEIGMARDKELHFFDDESLFSGKKIDYANYHRRFTYKKGYRIYGETTPIYIFWEPAMERIHRYNKDMKIIAILRDPSERAFSHWTMEINRNTETMDFLHCIQHESERTGNPTSEENRTFSYVARGFYSNQIRRARRYFPPESVLFLKYEDYLKNQSSTLNYIFEFLEVDPRRYSFRERKWNMAEYNRAMRPEEKQYLQDLYHEDILAVEELLGWDCSDWKNQYR